MKIVIKTMAFLSASLFSSLLFAGNTSKDMTDMPTAESMIAWASAEYGELDEQAFKDAFHSMTFSEQRQLITMAIVGIRQTEGMQAADDKVLLYVLAILLPPVAVALYTNLGMETVWNILWTFLGWVPGVIHAFIVISR